MPKISVIIPIYNVEKYLKKCLDSVINQTLKDIEIILVDNGANLAEKDIIKDYKKLDSRIIVIEFTNNLGYGKAINEGIKISKGKYISIIESDDYVDLSMFTELYSLAEKYEVDIIKSGYNEFNSNYSRKQLCDLNIPCNQVFRIVDYPIFLVKHPSIWSCLYKKEFLERQNIKFFEHNGTAWVDNPFQLETLYTAEKILYCPKAYYNYRKFRQGNASSLLEGISIPYICVKDMMKIVEKYNITDSEIICCILKRLVIYIDIIISQLNIKNFKIALDSINKMLDILMSYDLEDEKVLGYIKLKNKTNLFLYIFKKKLSIFLESILYIRINNKGSLIKFFNMKVYSSGVQL